MIYLAQTDTTAGFLSKDYKELNRIKGRDENRPCLIEVAKFSTLNRLTRVPNKFKNLIRRSKKTTFLYPNSKAIRVVKESRHAKFLIAHEWLYSTSANQHSLKFDKQWAISIADKVVDSEFYENPPSRIFKISKTKIKKLR